jgi:hypothetical protein
VQNKNKKGFVRAGYQPGSIDVTVGKRNAGIRRSKVLFAKGGKAFLLLEHDAKQKAYIYKGIVAFYESNIPKKYKHEFEELYEGKERVFDDNTEQKIAGAIMREFVLAICS